MGSDFSKESEGRRAVIPSGRNISAELFRQQLGLIEAFTDALHGADTGEGRFARALQTAGNLMGVDRVYVFKLKEEDRDLIELAALWTRDEIDSFGQMPAYTELRHDQVFEPEFIAKLMSGEPLTSSVKDAHLEVSQRMKVWGTQSVALVPVMVDGRFWGLFCADDVRYAQRVWRAEVTDTMGTLGQIFATSFDEHQRRSALDANLQLRSDMLERSLDVLFTTDTEGRFTFLSSAWERITGLPTAELIGQTLLAVVHDDDHHALISAGVPLWQGDVTTARATFRVHARDGTLKHMELFMHLLPDGQGASGTLRDLSAQRSQPERLRQAVDHDMLKRFAGGVAHEFDDVVQVALNATELVASHPDDPRKVLEMTDLLDGAVKRLAQLVRQLSGYAGQGKGASFPLDPNLLITKALRRVRCELVSTVVLEPPTIRSTWTVRGDEERLVEVLVHLIKNGIDAMHDGGGRLSVSMTHRSLSAMEPAVVRYQLPPGDYLAIHIEDQGEGIDAATMERVFVPFFSTRPTRRGMGLSASLGIIQDHRGALDLSSDLDDGTIATVYLPRGTSGLDDTMSRILRSGVGADRRVLVVSDEPSTLEIVSQTLRKEGFHVARARSGAEAKTELAFGELDACIVDYVLPDTSGFNLLTTLRKTHPAPAYIMMTGYIMERDGRVRDTNNPLPVLLKPFTVEQLKATLYDVLDS